jgi:hypothetical protein
MSENSITENENASVAENNSTSETAMAADVTATEQTTSAAEGAKIQEDVAATEAATGIVKIEGQEFPLDVAIAADDNLLKAALSPHYPSIKNAQISRETRAGQMIVSIVKKAEHKGSGRQQAA